MKKLALLFLLSISSIAQATLLTPTTVTGTGTYNNSATLITDNIFPAEWSTWTNGTNAWWNGTSTYFVIDYGTDFLIEDVLLSVDNNDSYQISYSNDGSAWTNLFTILNTYGEVGYGMDTMSSDSSNAEYIAGIDFAATEARYLMITAISGDNSYSIGELQGFWLCDH